ncbi:MAG: hypothetical protein COY66_05280 [Candidatus Kerfeldbacteria bacterium CG_4_10_14_0_8_um_filter_42_10]|uniref:Uncharacterized protein n=1 Tax=Candidatus Kerfeldbacteria bacterium CG_4_10_14_0_8_um_filter_42_10 TaxID=2014248 RepID=A0A2M7RH01_9BACT|nr:MAG: hypothetical protein COY66_05280 [Candidatus Kerfeldbacteria bacterium CG_4_10_14_0_8_um_filter_42_10]
MNEILLAFGTGDVTVGEVTDVLLTLKGPKEVHVTQFISLVQEGKIHPSKVNELMEYLKRRARYCLELARKLQTAAATAPAV